MPTGANSSELFICQETSRESYMDPLSNARSGIEIQAHSQCCAGDRFHDECSRISIPLFTRDSAIPESEDMAKRHISRIQLQVLRGERIYWPWIYNRVRCSVKPNVQVEVGHPPPRSEVLRGYCARCEWQEQVRIRSGPTLEEFGTFADAR